MNLAPYLMMKVTPLSEYTPERKHREMPERRRTTPRKQRRTLQEQSEATRNQAIARYRTVMGDGWMKTQDIDAGLGRPGGADRILRKWFRLGLVDRRPVGGVFHQARGYEWKFKEETK